MRNTVEAMPITFDCRQSVLVGFKISFACFLLLAGAALRCDASTATVSTASWPMFRGGPQLLGVASSNLDKELSLLWTYKTAGPVRSSAAIVGGKVFIGSGDQHVHAINLDLLLPMCQYPLISLGIVCGHELRCQHD